jgi:hypothetical protein
MSDLDGIREIIAEARTLNTALLARVRAGDIDAKGDVVVVAFERDEFFGLTIDVTQLAAVAEEYCLLIESGPSRDELLAASAAVAMAAKHAREANEQLDHIMGRLWLKPAPSATDVANDKRAEVG